MGQLTARRRVLRLDDRATLTRPDTLAVEEPLEIRLAGHPLAVTMRTPGHDLDLVAGFLITEGLVGAADDIVGMRRCSRTAPETAAVDVALAGGPHREPPVRVFPVTSACGVCGKPSADAIRPARHPMVRDDPVCMSRATLASLPATLRKAQRVFDRTGGLHAAGLFDHTGRLLCVREDIGRHNAVDKVVGWAAQHGRLPLRGCALQVSGRASFELVQKGLMAGVPLVAAVSAPSSLAVDLAEEAGMTLVGFVRGRSMNVYSGTHRVSR